jgi:sugar phosphate isomerase/epimerase
LQIDAYSRHLQWLRSPDDVAEAVNEMGYEGLDITVRTYPGHVDPERVAADLPVFVNAVRSHGIAVTAITTNISDADSPHAEDILRAASSLGITQYWWGTYRYEAGKPVMQQLDELKPRVAKLVTLNKKYSIKAMYHTYSGDVMVGAALWDFLYVLRDFDPAYVSFHYDTGHQTNAGGNNTWATSMRAAGPYIGGVSVKDSLFESTFQQPVGGGPLSDHPNATGADRGGPPPPGVTSGAPGVLAPGGGRGQEAPASGQPPGGRGGQSGGRGPGGRGRGAAPTANGWRVRQVPLGTGQVNLPLLAHVLNEIEFSGPIEVQCEYPMGGAENAMDKITWPRAMVLGAMKRDRLVLRQALAAEGLV